MDLIYNQHINADRLHTTIKEFKAKFPDEFEKTGIKVCGNCKGTGLTNRFNMNDFCDYCYAVGFTGFDKIGEDYICRTCNGIGCKLCGDRGTIDWISHAMGSDIGEKRRIKNG